MIYAKKGDIVTCDMNGCQVCKFTETVNYGDRPHLTRQLEFFPNQKQPRTGFPMHKCLCSCGGSWVKEINKFHFKDGWR